jgi:Flp pilus assembly protein TadD
LLEPGTTPREAEAPDLIAPGDEAGEPRAPELIPPGKLSPGGKSPDLLKSRPGGPAEPPAPRLVGPEGAASAPAESGPSVAPPPAPDITADIKAGDLAFARGDYRTATMLYRGAAATDPDSAPAQVRLGAAYLLRGRVDAAVSAWILALEIDPENDRLRARLEELLDLRDRVRTAGGRGSRRVAPTPPDERLTRARRLLREGRATAALVDIDRAAADGGDLFDVARSRGDALVELGRYEASAAAYRAALAASPGSPAPLRALGAVYRRAGDRRRARYHFERYLEEAERSGAEDGATLDEVRRLLGR